jgi:hypothetical protein
VTESAAPVEPQTQSEPDYFTLGAEAARAGAPKRLPPELGLHGRSTAARSWFAGHESVSVPTAAEGVKPVRERVQYMQAKQSFVTMFNGEPTQVSAGDLVHPDHPILQGRAELFQPAKNHIRFDVEQATASPGEKRGA